MITNTRYVQRAVYTTGRSVPIDTIVIHQYNTPEDAGTYKDTIDWLFNSAPVSVHYVVSGKSATRMVRESDTAWHAREANSRSIGIEFDPNNMDYQFAGEFVRWVAKRHGITRILSHNQAMSAPTSCPATIDWKRIINLSKKESSDMLKNKNHLKVMFRQFVNRDPKESEFRHYIGKTYGHALEKLHKAQISLPTLIKERNKLEARIIVLEKQLNNVIDIDEGTIKELQESIKELTKEKNDLLEDNIELNAERDTLEDSLKATILKLDAKKKGLNKLGEILMILVDKVGRG